MVSQSRDHPFISYDYRSAVLAVQNVVLSFVGQRCRVPANPLVFCARRQAELAQIVSLLVQGIHSCAPSLAVEQMPAIDFAVRLEELANRSKPRSHPCKQAGAWVIEGLQDLPMERAEPFIEFLDECVAYSIPVVLTSFVRPSDMPLPARLRSRLVGGLVVEVGR